MEDYTFYNKATEGLAIGQRMSNLEQLTPEQITFAKKFKPEIIEKWETLSSSQRNQFRQLYSRYIDEGKPVDFKLGAAKLSETKLQKSTQQKTKIEEVINSVDYQKSGMGTKQELLDAGIDTPILRNNKWDRVFEHLDNLEPGSLVSAKGLSRELFDNNPSSAPSIREIIRKFFPNINLAKTKEQIAQVHSEGTLRGFAEKRAAEPVLVPTARRNTEGVITHIDWPDGTIKVDGKTLSIEDAYIEKLKDIYSRPKENRTNYELAKSFWGIENPTAADTHNIVRVNSFLTKELNLVKEKAEPNQSQINRAWKIANSEKYLSRSDFLINKRINDQVTVINNHFIKFPTDILNYPKLMNLMDARLETVKKDKASDKVQYTGEIVSKPRDAGYYVDKVQSGLLDLFHIDAVATGKRSIMYPSNLLMSVSNINEVLLNQANKFVENTKPTINGEPNPVFENGIRNLDNLLKENGLTYVLPGYGKIGINYSEQLWKAEAGTIPSIDQIKDLLGLPDLMPTSSHLRKPRIALNRKDGGRVGYKKGGQVKLNTADYIEEYGDGTELIHYKSSLRAITKQLD